MYYVIDEVPTAGEIKYIVLCETVQEESDTSPMQVNKIVRSDNRSVSL